MLKRNILFSLLANISRFIFGLMIFVLLTRSLDISTFGLYIYIVTITGYFSIFIDFGFNLSILNDVPKNKERVKNIFYEILVSKLVLTIISFFLLLVLVYFINKEDMYIVFIMFMSVSILQSFSVFISQIFKAFNNFSVDLLLALVNGSISLTFIYIYHDKLTLALLGQILVLVRLIGLVVVWAYFNHYFSYIKVIGKLKLNIKPIFKNFKYAVHMVVGGMFLSVDILIMKEILTLGDVAKYSAGIKLFAASVLIGEVISTSFMPRLSELSKSNSDLFEKNLKKLIILTSLLGGIASLLTLYVGEFIILYLYGNDFNSIADMLPYFSIALFIRYLSFPYGMLVTLAGKQHLRAGVMVVVFIIHIFLNIFFQSKLGTDGAIISLCISFSIITLINIIIAYRCFGRGILLFKVNN